MEDIKNKENNIEIIESFKLKDFFNQFPDNSKKFYKNYFENNTKKLYDFFGVNFEDFNINFNKNKEIVSATLETSLSPETQALGGNAHGGSIAFIVDAAMGLPIGFAKLLPFECIILTRELSKIEIFKPVPTGEKIIIDVVCEKEIDARKFLMSMTIKKDNEILVSGSGFFLKVPIYELM